jgi:hypothetical protein
MKSIAQHLVVILVTIAVVIGFLNIIPDVTNGKKIISFENGGGDQTEWEVELGGEMGYASDSSTYFSVPLHKGRIQKASLDITCTPNENGDTLLNPRLDVGIDGDYEWQFLGNGYGAINHQTVFTNNMNRKVVAIGKNTLSTHSTSIFLPKGAQISSATMTLEGGDLAFGEVYLAAVNQMNDVYYIKSNGDRTFGKPVFVENLGQNSSWPRSYSYGIGIGDFDNDGDNDIITNEGNSGLSTVGNIYLIEKTGPNNTFASKKKVGTTGYYRNTDFAVGDFNNDNLVDFIGSEWNKNIYYFKNTGGLTFNMTQLTSSFSGGNAYGKDAADFNLDGYLDVAVGGSTSGSLYIYPGNGDGTFKNSVSVTSGTQRELKCVIAGDYNIDGNPDIIAKDYSWWPPTNFQFIPGKGDLTFAPPIDTGNSLNDWNIAGDGFDFDFDGNPDYITNTGNTIHVFWGNGAGGYTSSSQINGIPSSIYGISTPSAEALGGCDNLIVDIGRDGTDTANFQPMTGPFNSVRDINFKSQLDSLLASPSIYMEEFTDEYGNTIYEIPIKFSASKIGNVMLRNMSIRYTYTAKVDVNPHNENLVNELNDLIPKTGVGEFNVHLKIAADSPGKVTFKNLNVEFNEAPILSKDIPDMEMSEGTNENKLRDLAVHYDDDGDSAVDLKYSVLSYTESDNLRVSINDGHYLHVNATLDPDWHGMTKVVVQAEDSESGITRSNEFQITINPVNDPPRIWRLLSNIELKTNEVHDDIDLDDPAYRYFYDIDSNEMFFRAIINSEAPGEFDDYLKLEIDNDTALFKFRAFNNYMKNIPVRVYCSDFENVRTMSLSSLANVPTYQDFIVNVTKFGMGKKPTFPPVWQEIEDIMIPEDEIMQDWINLNNYTSDPDDELEDVTFTIESLTNSAFVNVYITTSKDKTQNILSIEPEANFDGEASVILRAEDDEHNYALNEFKVEIIPEPDIPIVEILSPMNGSMISGINTISGSAYDPESEIKLVQLKIGDADWVTAEGLAYWSYVWDASQYTTTKEMVTIKARAMDLENSYSELDIIKLIVDNATEDTDKDGVPDVYDALPTNPLDSMDQDGDGVGDNTDRFPTEPTQWDDVDEDGYGDNPSGKDFDAFPYDPTQWKDSDGDGYGDNLEGNNPDHYPNDSSEHAKSGSSTDESVFSTGSLIWLAVIPFILIDLYIFNSYRKKRQKSNEDNKNE